MRRQAKRLQHFPLIKTEIVVDFRVHANLEVPCGFVDLLQRLCEGHATIEQGLEFPEQRLLKVDKVVPNRRSKCHCSSLGELRLVHYRSILVQHVLQSQPVPQGLAASLTRSRWLAESAGMRGLTGRLLAT